MKRYMFFAAIFMLVSIFTIKVQAVTVMIEPATQNSPIAGGTMAINVKVNDANDVFGYEFKLGFDNTAIKVSKIEEGELLKNDGASTIAFLSLDKQMVYLSDVNLNSLDSVNSAGFLTVASVRLNSDKGAKGSGTLVKLTFEVKTAKASVLELSDVKLADPNAARISPVDLKSGAIEFSQGIKGDVNKDTFVNAKDAALVLRISTGLLIPDEYQKWAADIVEDGLVNSKDATRILRISAGFAAPAMDVIAKSGGQINISLSEAYGIAGESITVPIQVDNSQILGGGDISVNYNPAILRAVDVMSDQDLLLVSNVNEPGTIRIAFATSNNLNKKTIANIKFHVIADDTSPLSFGRVELYTPETQNLVSRSVNKEFRSWAMPPERSELLQNFPNPFNPETWMPYQLKLAGEVTIKIYNTTGEIIRELDLGHKSAGLYVSKDRAAYWDGKNKFGMPVSSGVYFYSIQSENFSAVKKLIVLK
jgi:hypothetical protein